MRPDDGVHDQFEFDVFLSFTRESDLLNGFTEGLCATLEQRDVRASFGEQEKSLDDAVAAALRAIEGTSNIEAIALDIGKKDLTDLRTEAFAAMSGLRLLHIANVNFAGDFTCIPNKLKWLKWEGCPFKSLPSEFNLQEVVVLDLSFGMVSEVWNRNVSMIKAFDRLKVLNLMGCKHLTATPDFSSTPHIVKLKLDECILLAQVHESIGSLKNLICMSMRDCYQLKELPNSICELSSLETLNLHKCSKVSALAMHVGDMKSLKRLVLDQTKIKTLPDSMTQLKKLNLLSLDGCRSLTELPEWIGSMESLRNLTLSGSTVERIPESIGHLTNLARLNAGHSSIVALPHSIGKAKNLRGIYVDYTAIEEVPDSIGSLERLETLSLDGCNHIKFLPSTIGLLKNLAELSIGATLGCTGGIRELPESFGSLTALRRLYINRNAELLTVPSSFFQISSLEDLSARGCNWLEGVHGNDFSKLSSLKKLNLADGNFYTLPSFASFSFLKTLTLSFCERLLSIPQLPSSLEELLAMDCSALEIISDISDLKVLRVLKLDGCTKLIDVHGLEKLRFLEDLTLHSCSNLSHALRDRIKEAEFEYLSYFTISGILGLHQSKPEGLSFVLPKMFGCNYPQLQITGNFKDRNATAVHIEVMVASRLLFETTREPNLQLDDYCICYFKEGDEMLTHVGDGYRMMHVWIDGFIMAGATIYMATVDSF
ncbi:Leucine-rich repeat-containing protein 1 [Nymphaea thermarum]|nr:Leucine-rich repeat-containing protein 1 [Nymphaea thermarum]